MKNIKFIAIGCGIAIVFVIVITCALNVNKPKLTLDKVTEDLINYEYEVAGDVFTAEEILEVIETEDFTVSTEYKAFLDSQVEQLPELDLSAGDGSNDLLIKESEEFRQLITDKVIATYSYTGIEEPLNVTEQIDGFSEIETIFVLCAIESFTRTGDYSINDWYSVGEDSCIEFLFREDWYTIVADRYITDFLICKGKLR